MAAPEAAIHDALSDSIPTARMIVAARDLFDFAARLSLPGELVDPYSSQTIRFLQLVLAGRENEAMHAIYLDADGGYLGDEKIGSGVDDRVGLSLRLLIGRLLEVGARGLVLAHNHPSGDTRPSQADRAATSQLSRLTEPLGIALIDHLIVAGQQVFSMARGRQL